MPFRLLSFGAETASFADSRDAGGFGGAKAANSSETDSSQKQQPKSKVYLIHSDLLRKDSRHPDAQVVVGNVVFRHDSVYMYCDSAYYYDKISSFEAFSNVKMNQGDTLFCMETDCL